MKVYNKEKTQVLQEYDLSKGYLIDDEIITHHNAVAPVKEVGHYETVAEYPNGGKDVKFVVDVPAQEGVAEHTTREAIKVYIPYTEKELAKINATARIAELKKLLCDTDYKAIKYAEGVTSAEDYAPIKALRQSYRNEINELEKVITED